MTAQGNLARTHIDESDTAARNTARLEDRYALALYELAVDSQALAAVEKDIASLVETIADNEQLQKALAHPLIDRAAQERVLHAIATNIGANALTRKFIALVSRKRRQAELLKIFAAFQALCAARRGELTADVRVAAALSPAQTDELARVLSTKHNATVKLNVIVDPAVLGGMAVKIGATLYDRTVQSQLSRLQAKLEEAA